MLNIKKINKNKLLIIGIAALIMGVAGVSYYYLTSVDRSKSTSVTPSIESEDKPVGNVDYTPPTHDEENPITDTTETSSTPSPAASTAPIPVTISYMGGNPVQIRVLISEILGSGQCVLELKKAGATIHTETVDIFATSNSSTCKGFSVEPSMIGSGDFLATVTVKSGARTGKAERSGTL